MKRREWLVQQGLAKDGRGKFSNAAKEALAKAEAGGMKFSDSVPVPVRSQTGNPTKDSAGGQSSQKIGLPEYLFPDEYRFPEAEYRAFHWVNGKKVIVSLREVCNDCGVSLVNHGCDSPTILGNISVTIERR